VAQGSVRTAAVLDVFISYAHEDNDYPRYGQRGWVEYFYEALKARLNGIRREEIAIWRDQSEARITGGTVLTPTIKEKLSDCAVLVVVVSPAYLASKWCADELGFFRDAAGKRGGLCVTTKSGSLSRVLKVLKLPVELGGFRTGLAEVDDAVGYPLYQRTAEGRPCIPPIELDPPYGENIGTDFGRAVNALAYDIDAILQGMSSQTAASASARGGNGACIYLAETSSDMADYRERMRQELEQFGFAIAPAVQQFPGPNYAEIVKSGLAGARLSVHLVGESYGLIPERADQSIVELQYRVAGNEAAARPEFSRMAWMPPGVTASEERQRGFIATLRDDPHLVVAPFEDFKTLVHDALKPKVEPSHAPAHGEPMPKSVYLIFDAPDQARAKSVDDWLFDRGFEVLKRSAETKSRKQLALHKEFLRASDGVLIYYGQATDEWLQMNLIELRKVFATESRRRPPCGVVLGDPKRPDKEGFRSNLVHVIPGFGGFSPDRLEEFVHDLEGTQPASA
jgi:hypothetical protein